MLVIFNTYPQFRTYAGFSFKTIILLTSLLVIDRSHIGLQPLSNDTLSTGM